MSAAPRGEEHERNDRDAADESTGGMAQPSASNEGNAAHQDDLAVHLSKLARSMQNEEDPDDILQSMVHAAIELIPGVEQGSVSVVMGRKDVSSRAASSDLPKRIDAIQMEVGEGPCLDAVYDQRTVRVANMEDERRWPEFSQRAFEAGAGSMLSFQLFVEGDNLGALNLYASDVNAFSDESEHIGLLVAAHAAIAFADSQKTRQLNEALSSRDLIGQAKGILMERHKLTGQQAFLVLARASQNANMKLIEVAGQLADTGEIPGQIRR